jgi:hypothetical protein
MKKIKYVYHWCLLAFLALQTNVAHAADEESVKITNPLAGIGINNIWDLVTKLFSWAIMFAGIVATGTIIYAGYKLITAGGDSNAIKTAGNQIKWSLIGLVVILSAYAIVELIVKTILNGP